MFCTHCGTNIPEGANFCGGCGAALSRAPAAAPAPPPLHASATAKCAWCGAPLDASQTSCPRCGATTKASGVPARAEWGELPGRKDMAKLQFGNSFCQIEGLYVPVADINLAAGDSVYFTHHVLLWKDTQVNVTTMPMKGAWKRLFAGMPLIMTEAHGPGHIAFSKDNPGELIPVPLQPGQALDVREHLFLVATNSVAYDWFQTGIWFTTKNGDDTETHYPVGMFMDRFTAPQAPGLLLLHAGGNVFVRNLGPYESILIKPTALIFKDPAVQMHLHFEHPSAMFTSWGYWSNRYLWLRLTGPGRVAIQSVFERIEGEARNMTSFSYATEQRW
ncbi:MAG TPA: AIM24 family protein [Bryobacteraceae bacterium]|nr:AIM24 family protein [Bryobacteraceae bacterium]